MMETNTERDDILKSLGGLSGRIRDQRKKFESIDFGKIQENCIKVYDQTLDILLSMEQFLEDNIDLFTNEKQPRMPRICEVEKFGCANHRCPVNTYFFKNTYCIAFFLDSGLHFVYNYNTRKVLSISNNKGLKLTSLQGWGDVNSYEQYKEYKMFRSFHGARLSANHVTFPSDGYTRFFNPCSGQESVKRCQNTEEAKSLMSGLQHDYELANETFGCLKEAIERIEQNEKDYDVQFKDVMVDVGA